MYPGMTRALLPPANQAGEGYAFTPVCQSFCSRGGGVPGQVHPLAGTPPPAGAVNAGRFGQQASDTHPTGMHSLY